MYWTTLRSKQSIVVATLLALAITSMASAASRVDDQTWPLYVNVEQDGRLITGLTALNFRVFLEDLGQDFELQGCLSDIKRGIPTPPAHVGRIDGSRSSTGLGHLQPA
jgi:hypothetical protein